MIKNTDAEKRYFAETALALRREGYRVEQLDNGHLRVMLNDLPLCEVSEIGGIRYREEYVETTERVAEKDKVYGVIRTTAEYMRQMEYAPPLAVSDLKDRYRVLADFNGTVLACANSKFGIEFVTWSWDANRKGVSNGHFFGENYKKAKHDFACRSGLVQESRQFTDEQLTEMYRCIHETMESGYPINKGREDVLKAAAKRIEYSVDDLDKRVNLSNQQELEGAGQQESDHHGMGMSM